MVISAKFESSCTKCKGRIFQGDRVIWNRGVKGVSHARECMPNDRPVAVAEPVTIAAEPVTLTEVVAEPATLTNPRDPKELCAFLTSLSREQLQALSEIVSHEIARREPETRVLN